MKVSMDTSTGTASAASVPTMEQVHSVVRRLKVASYNHGIAGKNYSERGDDSDALVYLRSAKELRAAMDALIATGEPFVATTMTYEFKNANWVAMASEA